ncbi:MAG: esterase, partial [Acidobacteria bacterium]|nr:esterase [Acidobacteriota bacterium]
MRKLELILAGLVLFLVAGCAASQVVEWEVDGIQREGIVYAPKAATEQPTPLVLAFHGFGDMALNFQRTDIHEAWPEAIVVYFQGLTTRRGMPGWQSSASAENRDLRMVDIAVAALRETYQIDDARIYATGFSNGGMFTYLLWAE